MVYIILEYIGLLCRVGVSVHTRPEIAKCECDDFDSSIYLPSMSA